MNLRSYLQNSVGRFSRQAIRVAGVSFDTARIGVVIAVHKNGKAAVEKAFSFDLPAGSSIEKARVLKDRWAQEGIAASELVLTFPQRRAIVKTLTLPSTQPREIAEMVRLQAARQTPLGLDEVAVAHHVLEKTSQGYSRVMMVIVRKDDIRAQLEVFEEAGLSPARVVLDSLVALPYISGETPPTAGALHLVIEVKETEAVFGLFQAGALYAARSVHLPALEKEAFEIEVKRTMLTHPASPLPGAALGVSLTGPEALVNAAREILRNAWGCSATVIHPSDRSPVFARGARNFPGWPCFAAAMTDPAFVAQSSDLLPESEQRRRGRRYRRHQGVGVLVCASLFGIAIAGSVAQSFYAKQRELNRLTVSCAAVAAETKELRRMDRKITAIKTQMSQEGSLLHLLAELNRLVPAGVSLRGIDFERGRSIVLQGNCLALSEALRLVEMLQKSELFADVELRSSDNQRMQDRDVVDFTVACRWRTAHGPT